MSTIVQIFTSKSLLLSKRTFLLFCGIFIVWSCFSKGNSNNTDSSNDTIPDDSGKKYINEGIDSALIDMVEGPSIQIDPLFPYYKSRSDESIAEEIELRGYKSVHYIISSFNKVNGDLIDAFHDHDIKVWLMAYGNGTNLTDYLPDGWEDWKMKLTDKTQYIYFSPFNDEYVEWKKESLAELIDKYPFDGIEMAESFFSAWDGFERGSYGDIGHNAKVTFKKQYGKEMPNFVNPNDENYYKKVPSLYEKWIDFRVDGMNDYLDEIINGEGGIRDTRPDALVATWGLGIDAGKNVIFQLKEYQGVDAPSMIETVKPDIHFIQTHWPDWVKSESQLPSEYMRAYKPFYDQVKEKAPNLPIGLQADIGSNEDMIKSKKWFDKFKKEASSNFGYNTITAYEYFIGGYMYHEKPVS